MDKKQDSWEAVLAEYSLWFISEVSTSPTFLRYEYLQE